MDVNCGNKIIYKNKNGDLIHYKRLYNIFNGMRLRCYNKKAKNYPNYGGKGIKICKEWKNHFMNFCDWALENGYKENLTIDRIDVNGNYEPNNCRWVTMLQQENNRKNNIFLKYNNQNKTLKQWGRELNIPYGTIYARYCNGFSARDILSNKDLRRKNGRIKRT